MPNYPAKIKKIIKDIKNLKIQGATSIAYAALEVIFEYGKAAKAKNAKEFQKKIEKAAREASHARATEPLARNCAKYALNLTFSTDDKDVEMLRTRLLESVNFVKECLAEGKQNIVKAALDAEIIKPRSNVFTHCHSSLVEGVLLEYGKKYKSMKVFNTETRPRYQGRKTSEKLIKAGIDNTMVVDSAATFVVSHYSLKELEMNVVLLGSDAIALDGSCVNKIGSFGIAQTAYLEKIPVYVITGALRLDIEAKHEEEIKIEERDPREIWPNAPKKLKLINLAFDRVPEEFITGYVTEFGVLKPSQITSMCKKYYPWLFKT